ncbi:MAG: bifunctional precorrin-2 dehydrogenase/sirohydrochlorin ferrochelatase, partial [Desulfovibrionaceae bacterium]|nr:bifunctional precorrin-2 dehydrogenase/sirohydrochlorin ferrochelatase [Desulfovibrionaceae bacterium]
MDAYYHLGLSLADQTCIIIGFGEVGQRKLEGLLPTEVAQIKIFDPKPSEAAQKLVRDKRIQLQTTSYSEKDLLEATLVFACTGDPSKNLQIAKFCREHKILCNCTSDPKAGNVIIPAILRNEDLTLTLSSGGASPALIHK